MLGLSTKELIERMMLDQQRELAIHRALGKLRARQIEFVQEMVLRRLRWEPAKQDASVQPSLLTLEGPVVPDDKHVAFEADKADSTKQVITAGNHGPVNPMPKRRPKPEQENRSMTQKVRDVVKKMSFDDWLYTGAVAFLVFVVAFIAIKSFKGNEIDITSPEFQHGYSEGVEDGLEKAEWAYGNQSRASDTLYQHCDKSEGAGVDQGIVLYDPSNRTCYFGTQIEAHMAEVTQRETLEAEQLKRALYELGRLAGQRGVHADDSWRALAESFAATSQLPMAVEAGKQVFVEHGGNKYDFRPRVAKGGTLDSSSRQSRSLENCGYRTTESGIRIYDTSCTPGAGG